MDSKIYEGLKLENFRELVSLFKNEYKNLIAFEYKKSPNDPISIEINYSQFANDIEALGAEFLKLNSKRIAIIAPNRYEWCVAYLAATTAGLIVVPLDKSLPENEIIGLLERSKADTILYSYKYENAVKNCPLKICFDNVNTADNKYSSILKDGYNISHSDYDNIEIDNSKMSVMLFTSGTTSVAKAVMLSQHQICMTMYGLSQMIKLDSNDKFLSFLPLHHTFESSCTFLFGTQCGITIVFCDGLKYIQKNLVEYHITGFVCVPLMLEIMYKKMVKEIDNQHKTFIVGLMRKLFRHAPLNVKRTVFKSIINGLGGKLRTVVTGGAAMDVATLNGYNNFGFDIHQGYGLTETAGPIAGENSFYKKLGSVGPALPTVTLKIDNPDQDGIGEILVNSPSTMFGYYENENASSEVIVDGWFRTGDLGYLDSDKYLFITGRKKDMIVLKNGKKIFPEELEALINKLPYVSESMVFGYIDSTRTDRNDDVILCSKIVYNKDEISKFVSDENEYHNYILEDIKTKINKQMPAYKYIRKIIVTAEPLIKTTTQKIKRNEEMKTINSEILAD